ncbi:degenerin-like protein unc-105 [Pollicipes pollicipes]|uniref:degenerin-like protein unc-105 n=1 Tax=Pollicipes pollicipes TaxID=41117 RepID=UPI00188556BB|nr:degenerin-like protein unc-105 [Pollicipes pollicipes]
MALTGAAGRGSLWGVWRRTTAQFVSDTSVVGVNNVGRTAHPFRRFFWCCLFLAGLGITLNDVVTLVGKFFQYPVTTGFTMNYQDSVTFPAVTVCNQNSVMCHKLLDKLYELPDSAPLQKVVSLSYCMEALEKNCMVLYNLSVTYTFIPSFVRDSTCFTNSTDNCCRLEDFGSGPGAVNVSGLVGLLNCNCPGKQPVTSGPDQQSGTPGPARRRRNVGDPAAPSPAEPDTQQEDSVGATSRRRRRAASRTPTDPTTKKPKDDSEMGEDDIYEDKMAFYGSFANLSESTRKAIGQSFSEFIKSCSYNGKDCLNEAYFEVISSASYGNCFVFNGNISNTLDLSAGKRNSVLTGANYGLTLITFLSTENYMPSTVSQTVGARVTIHSSDVYPLSRITRQEYPYESDCYRTWSQVGVEPVKFNESSGGVTFTGERYTLAECHRICLQLRMVSACGCHHSLYPLVFAVEGVLQDIGLPCNLTYHSLDSNCTAGVVSSLSSDPGSLGCGCSVPCEEADHQPQLSVASWPQGKFLASLLQDISFVPMDEDVGETSLAQWAQQFSKLNVYYRDIGSAAVTESPTYTYTTFISSLGGALSLYLGIALILLVEILEYFFFMVFNTALYLCGRYEAKDPKTVSVMLTARSVVPAGGVRPTSGPMLKAFAGKQGQIQY